MFQGLTVRLAPFSILEVHRFSTQVSSICKLILIKWFMVFLLNTEFAANQHAEQPAVGAVVSLGVTIGYLWCALEGTRHLLRRQS
jgi:hypothetical protein